MPVKVSRSQFMEMIKVGDRLKLHCVDGIDHIEVIAFGLNTVFRDADNPRLMGFYPTFEVHTLYNEGLVEIISSP